VQFCGLSMPNDCLSDDGVEDCMSENSCELIPVEKGFV